MIKKTPATVTLAACTGIFAGSLLVGLTANDINFQLAFGMALGAVSMSIVLKINGMFKND